MITSNVKVMVVGDTGVGKTCLLSTFANNVFPTQYTPTIFDNMSTGVTIQNQTVVVNLWDTAGQEEYRQLRALSYPETGTILPNQSLLFHFYQEKHHIHSYDNIISPTFYISKSKSNSKI